MSSYSCFATSFCNHISYIQSSAMFTSQRPTSGLIAFKRLQNFMCLRGDHAFGALKAKIQNINVNGIVNHSKICSIKTVAAASDKGASCDINGQSYWRLSQKGVRRNDHERWDPQKKLTRAEMENVRMIAKTVRNRISQSQIFIFNMALISDTSPK